MKKRLNILINIISSILIIVCFLASFYLFYNHLSTSFEADVKKQALKIKEYYETGNTIDSKVAALLSQRVTVIEDDGTVLYDSIKDNLDNHLDREEIKEALLNGEGSSYRLSSSVDQNLYYYALKMDNGQILRIADDIDSIWSFSLEFIVSIFIFIIIVFTLSFILARKLVSYFIEPINSLNFEEPLLNETYPELQPILLKLEAHNQMRKEFSANVSHELKTPLQSIMGYSELILSDMAKQEDIINFNHKIYNEANRLYQMIEEIIALARLNENQIASEFEEVNYHEVLTSVLNKLDARIKNNNIIIQSDIRAVSSQAITTLVEEIFMNLISNAIKYRGDSNKIWIILSENSKNIFFIVKDQGIGISPLDLPRIYERFFRADKSHNKQIDGTGLGLAIVKYSVQLLHGTIEVNSELNIGSTFKVTIPKNAHFLE